MLDLDTIFDPDRVAEVVRTGQRSPCIGPESLPMERRIEWEERAAIMQYDGGLSRDQAEAEALTDILGQMRVSGEPIPGNVQRQIGGRCVAAAAAY